MRTLGGGCLGWLGRGLHSAGLAPTLSSDPLDQAVIAFDGDHTRAEIKAALDKAFAIYGLDPTDDNYRRAGSVLVALRQDAVDRGCSECSEMEILRAMAARARIAGIDFPQAAAVLVWQRCAKSPEEVI